MIKLKSSADDKHSIMASAARRMGLPSVDPETGKISKPQPPPSGGSSSSSSGTPLASQLGMPSALSSSNKPRKPQKDWSHHSNRINMGGTVYMNSAGGNKSNYNEEEDENDNENDDNTATNSTNPPGQPKDSSKPGEDDDDELDEFGIGDPEEEKALKLFHQKRIQELKTDAVKKNEFHSKGHGIYAVVSQDEFLPSVTASKYVVCHFYHQAFERCKIVDKHMKLMANKHIATRFISIDAEKAPFFVGKLQVKMLPTVVFFKDGIAIDRVIGFDDFGGNDDFTTIQFEKRLAKAGVIITGDKMSAEEKEDQRDQKLKGNTKIRKSKANQNAAEDDDDDDDD